VAESDNVYLAVIRINVYERAVNADAKLVMRSFKMLEIAERALFELAQPLRDAIRQVHW
jgi:predicted Zn-dependent protease